MQTTAQGFLIFELTRSPAYLGLVGFASGVPTWLLTLYGGVVADRVPRRKLIAITQSCMMVLAFVLAALTFLRLVQPWHVLVLASLLGIANSFDAPARQSFVSEMVGPDDLTNAIALNSTMFQTATVVGPATAGIVLYDKRDFIRRRHRSAPRDAAPSPRPPPGNDVCTGRAAGGDALHPVTADDPRPHQHGRSLQHVRTFFRHADPRMVCECPRRGGRDQRTSFLGPRSGGASRRALHRLADFLHRRP